MARKRIERRSTIIYDLDDAVSESTIRALTGASIGKQFEIYLREEVRARNLRPATAQTYKNAFKKYLDTMGIDEDTVVTDIRFKDYQIALVDSKLEGRSNSAYIRNIRPFFYWLMKAGVVEPEKITEPKTDTRPFTYYTKEELVILTKPPKKDASFVEVRNWAMVMFMAATGSRVGSLPEIRIRDIDFETKMVQLTRVKTRKPYLVPLAAELEKALRWYINDCLYGKPDSFWLFPSQYGTQLTPDAVKHAMIKYNRSRGVTRTSQHDYRRAFGQHHMRTDGNIVRLQKALGHERVSTTEKYFKHLATDLQEGFDEHNLLNNLTSDTKKRGETLKRKK